MKLTEFKQEWDNITLLKCFEVPVLDNRTNEATFIVFDIQIVGRSFVAQFEALTEKQNKSKKIACIKRVIDLDFSLDNNLQELHEDCTTAIIDSDFFTLAD